MNQKIIIAILGVVAFALIGTTVYFAMTKNVSQPAATTSNVVQQPAPTPTALQPTTNQPTASLDITTNWQTYKNEQYGFEFKYPASQEFKVEKFETHQNISIEPSTFFSIYSDKAILNSNDYPWLRIGKELIKLQNNYDGYQNDLSAENRSECGGQGDCGPLYYNILKRKIDGISAIDYRQNSVGGPDRIIIFEKNEIVFQFYHGDYYPIPFNEDEIRKSVNYIQYQNVEKILSTFKFTN